LNRKERQLEALLGPTIEGLGCRLWGIEHLSHGRRSVLRVYIDRDEGVTIDDCERVSRQISAVLDVEEPLTGSYTLEVSSPGMDRCLFRPEQYAESIGESLDVRLTVPFEGRRRFAGELVGFENNEVVLRMDDHEFLIPLENVQRARIVPNFG
jgi:ribosome maturation factor RimP